MTQTPEQPEGIDAYSTALPTPEGAARRVNDFLSWFGDGLVVAETGKPPLFARDLQVLANLVTRDLTTVREFCGERAEYVRVLRQCTDASADYHRWQGHAEARRQLSERLGLPTAWPATAQEGPAA